MRFGLLVFLTAACPPGVTDSYNRRMDTARRVPSLEPEFMFYLLAMQAHRRSDYLAPDGGKRYSAVANMK